jgi:ubiquinone/menaquinone biosynthesis C-methylase UbiE
MSQPSDLHTDRRHLTTAAYANSANLMARADIYKYQQPPIDIVGWAFGQVRWEGVERVVDVGCGPGQYLRPLAQRAGLCLVGLDLSRGMLADLERGWRFGLPRPHLAVADAQALPLPDASCDLALAMHMLYHVPDIEQAARELRRVLRPGGVLLALTNGARHTQEMNEVYATAVARLSDQQATPEPRWSRRFALENGAALLRHAFAQVKQREIASTLIIPEAAPVLGYFASTRATREPYLPAGVAWDAVMAEAEQIVTETVASQGAFRVQTHVGLFICR